MKNEIKVGFCIAYDWQLLQYSIPLIYEQASKICLSIDKDRISWSGNTYAWDEESFRTMISGLDHEHKVTVLEENYHSPALTPIRNEFFQRKRMSEYLGEGGWHIQLDCDEYFLDFAEFVKYLDGFSGVWKKRINVCCAFIHLYKKVGNGFLVINPVHKSNVECVPIATRGIRYDSGRKNKGYHVITNFRVLHQSWARTGPEIEDKIFNWGHSHEFDKESYLMRWQLLDDCNYIRFQNFHPLNPGCWPGLKLIEGGSIAEIIKKPEIPFMPFFSKKELFFFNSVVLQNLNSVFSWVAVFLKKTILRIKSSIKS